ncbi:MAG: N-acetyl-gamma-glutamyl-phosphate reductase [Candidatus Acidiferrum sp.]|jgi:N-acetyl-gamma-glutamyl-phosphate reductase
MRDPAQVAVLGVTGYSGQELAELLLRHPAAKSVTFYVRDPKGARCLSELFPRFRGWGNAPVRALPQAPGFPHFPSLEGLLGSSAGTAFLATPHEASATLAMGLAGAGFAVIDLSAAYRFKNAETYSAWYQLPTLHQPLLEKAVYGLPELYPSEKSQNPLARAQLVANPGCYATSVILALYPLTQADWLAPGSAVLADCKSGASGAGKEPRKDLHFVEVDENFKAYNLFSHRHTPEILEHTGLLAEQLTFSTHLLPIARGILSTVYVALSEKRTLEEVEALFRQCYAGRPMVRISASGALPELQHVTRTNFCDLGFALDKSGRRLIIVSCLDNLGKGAAGQAIQNWNLMQGLEEHTGLQ